MSANERIADFSYSDPVKHERIDGKIYFMAGASKPHKRVQENLSFIFGAYFRQKKKKCEAMNEARLNFPDGSYAYPDTMVFCYEDNRDDKEEVPIIVIEVLSKSTRKQDLGVKMKKYAELGIKEYWVIAWEFASIDIYILGDNGEYRQHKSYAYLTEEDFSEHEKVRELEMEGLEILTEFSPESIPEMSIKLEEVFYFVI